MKTLNSKTIFPYHRGNTYVTIFNQFSIQMLILFNLQKIGWWPWFEEDTHSNKWYTKLFSHKISSPGDEQKPDFAHEDGTEELELEPWKWKQSS